MPTKNKLLKKLRAKPISKTFSINDLDTLMNQCGCTKEQAGRGSGVKYSDGERSLIFDLPHLGKELYNYQVKMVIKYLIAIGEIKDEGDKK